MTGFAGAAVQPSAAATAPQPIPVAPAVGAPASTSGPSGAPPDDSSTALAITHLWVEGIPVEGELAVAAVGQTLDVEVDRVALLTKAASGKKPIGLFLDGEFVADMAGHNPPGTNVISFRLQRTAKNKAAWSNAVGWPGVGARAVRIAVGLEDRSRVTTDGHWSLQISVFHGWFMLLFLPFVGIAFLAWRLARNTSLLRDHVAGRSAPTAGAPTAGAEKEKKTTRAQLPPYSLGKTQMAAWFLNIILAYLFIWASTGAIDALTPSMLVLLGIGSATALGATVIDRRPDLDAKPATPPPPGPAPVTRGFLNDVLSDEAGYSLPRMQILIWTCILMTVFWVSVARNLTMPDFNESVLALMGVSSGTYLWFKVPEKKQAAASAAPQT